MKNLSPVRQPAKRDYLHAVISLAVMGDPQISAAAKVTFGAIANLCEFRPEYVATYREIAELTGMSDANVRKSICRLRAAGYIRTQRWLHGLQYELAPSAKAPLRYSNSALDGDNEERIPLPEGRNISLPECGHSATPRTESSSRTPRQQQDKDSNKNELDVALETHLGAQRKKGESHAA